MKWRPSPTAFSPGAAPRRSCALERRAFLKALGSSVVALPFVEVLANSVAHAADDQPLKFIGVYHPHGIAAEYWAMRPEDTETDFDITYENCSLAPFDDPDTYGKSYKDKILVIEGIDLLSSANGHDTAATILTGSRVSGKPANISLDQYLAATLGLGSSTRLASAALAVGLDGSEPGTTLSYGEGGEPLSKIIDPVKAFDLFFAGFVVGDDPEAIARAARQRALGKSVIDFVHGDIQRLHGRVGPREQQKLDQHLTSLRELEKQFTEATGSCALPGAPDPSAFPSLKAFNGGEPYYDAITDAIGNMPQASPSMRMRCMRSTRPATTTWSSAASRTSAKAPPPSLCCSTRAATARPTDPTLAPLSSAAVDNRLPVYIHSYIHGG